MRIKGPFETALQPVDGYVVLDAETMDRMLKIVTQLIGAAGYARGAQDFVELGDEAKPIQSERGVGLGELNENAADLVETLRTLLEESPSGTAGTRLAASRIADNLYAVWLSVFKNRYDAAIYDLGDHD